MKYFLLTLFIATMVGIGWLIFDHGKLLSSRLGASTARVTLLVTGDVLTARSVNAKTIQRKDFTWAWAKTADRLRTADITFINLETPLINNCPIKNDGMIFCGDPRHVEGLKFAGVDVVNFANNHAGNQSLDGVKETVSHLQNAGLIVSGVNGPVYKEVNGTRFAFVGYNEVDHQVGIAHAEDQEIIDELNIARQNADVVIVQFHWGIEYTYQPSRNQRRLARLAIDHGADLIVSNHPHWFQAMEMYKGKLIVYSHGNFIFDQMWSRETREGLVGEYTFENGKLVKYEFLPVLIEDYGQPRWLEGKEKDQVLQKLEKANQQLAPFTQ